ncbi:tRNA lysidine(34) synthetase TilS [Sphingomonas rubra]|uniref:tRNA(Ile)-lysidine synthase n=1 Tax=Sphingomonas rubra TaxID=634430 RepID=A0A1I5U6K9_9SPHN|nr:tRNA lysidine(34) synthetase TilS [Sphingomonas rubra]SFP90899.1 tRNA(Ile)-lysidine synthase [Sphingomonas rubra]
MIAPQPHHVLPTTVVERFAHDWRRAIGDEAGGALVALSGGADSSALLLLMAGLGRGDVHAATVDHGLRPEARAEAVAAGELARRCGIPHAILSGAMPRRVEQSANLSARARALRYRLLEEHAAAVGARWIVTAHHADDQLETMVMRLNRGAGIRGLAGVRARQGRVVRPLLGWRRAELAAIVAVCGVVPVDDPSNVDDRFDRTRLRKVLAGVDWLDRPAIGRSATALAEAEAAIDWAAERLAGEVCVFGAGEAWVSVEGVPVELRRRLVERCLRHVDPAISPRGEAVGRVMARLDAGAAGTLGDVGYSVGRDGRWNFREAPPRRTH